MEQSPIKFLGIQFTYEDGTKEFIHVDNDELRDEVEAMLNDEEE